ncbi:SDR family oxidoreductase [Patescibacteria group bacterium]|nr:SDR family oxidoreductase [Patescibacteria group bacterium]MCL5091653.1 SDR family oxidoreductase [Patescibacteria group bacterium]
MKVIIAGGAGFIGSNLTDYFINRHATVTVIDNLITGKKTNLEQWHAHPRLRFIETDVCDLDISVLPKADRVYHLASPASPIQYKKHPLMTMRANSTGTERLLEFCRRSGSQPFIFTSTSEVYGDPLVHPQVESYWGNVNPVGVRSCYDESKRYAEALAVNYQRKYRLDVRIARLFNTYGPRMEKNDGRVVSNFIMQAITQQPITIYGDGQQTRSFCYVDDMVNALAALGDQEKLSETIINLGNPHEITISQLATIIKTLTGSRSKIVTQPIGADDPKKRQPDITKAKRYLNWQPTIGLETGLKKTIAYFQNHYRN